MEALKHTPLVEKAIIAIRQMIVSQQLIEGEKLPPEHVLCRKLGISRSTLREAYRALQAMGFIELRPGKGAFVYNQKGINTNGQVTEWFTIHEDELLDCFAVREALEPLAVCLAIKRAEDHEIFEILGVNALFEQSVEQDDSAKMALYDEMFHERIMRASHNHLLIRINERINKILASYRSKSFAYKNNSKNAIKPHRDIAAALLARDEQKAKEAVIDHVQISKRDIEKAVKR